MRARISQTSYALLINETANRAVQCGSWEGTAMDPVTGWTIVKSVGEASKKLYEIGKTLKDREVKASMDEVLDKLRELKQQASELEDANRDLRESLRFKSEEFEFKNPFWYEKAYPNRPLCAKCFAGEKIAPMSEPSGQAGSSYRRCLVCGNPVNLDRGRTNNPGSYGGSGGGTGTWS
jgi:hypothetical protein